MALAQTADPLAQPEPRRLSLMAVVLGVLVASIVVLTTARFLVAPLDRFDEGVTLTKAWLLTQGLIPYRDFWATYGPLDMAMLAAAFKTFAPDVLVERGLGVMCALAFSGCGFLVLTTIRVRGALRWLMTALLGLVPLAIPAFNSAVLADLIALLAFYAFTKSLRTNDWRWTAATGASIALASFARPELAVALGVALAAGTLVATTGRWRRLRVLSASAAAGAIILWLPVILAAGPAPVLFDLVHYALVLYPRARSIPLGQGPEGGAALVLAIVFALVWAWALLRLLRGRVSGAEPGVMVALLLSGLFLFAWVRTRADGAHALTAWPPTCLLLAVLMASRRRVPPPRTAEAVLSVAALLSIILADGALVSRDLSRPSAAWNTVPRATLIGARAWMAPPDLARLIQMVDTSIAPGEPVFVGLQDNANVVFNDTALYFLTGRQPPTPYFEFLPGFTNSGALETILTCQLDRTQTRLAILGPNAEAEPWNASAQTGAALLDSWIAAHQSGSETVGPYRLVWLSPDPAPPSCPSAES